MKEWSGRSSPGRKVYGLFKEPKGQCSEQREEENELEKEMIQVI